MEYRNEPSSTYLKTLRACFCLDTRSFALTVDDSKLRW
jgi:hypothetical protein